MMVSGKLNLVHRIGLMGKTPMRVIVSTEMM